MQALSMTLRASLVALLCTRAAYAAAPADFSGSWSFAPGRSQNVGMMASVQYTSIITQTDKLLVTRDVTVYDGKKQSRETRYDLDGTEVANESSMGDPSRTITRWDGAKLVTRWTSTGAVAGTSVVRTETRWLSPDGKQMSVQLAREGRPPMVLVFERV